MATFDEAIATILKHEGGFIHHPNDPGGATNFGISLRFLTSLGQIDYDFDDDGDIDAKDIQSMCQDDARKIYQQHWWNKYEYYRINNQAIATKLFDMAVNMGHKQAVKLLQRVCQDMTGDSSLVVDGVLGPKTIGVVNATNPIVLLKLLRSEQAAFYQQLIDKNPKLAVFEKGWLKRAYA